MYASTLLRAALAAALFAPALASAHVSYTGRDFGGYGGAGGSLCPLEVPVDHGGGPT